MSGAGLTTGISVAESADFVLCCEGKMTELRQSCRLVNCRKSSKLQHLLTILWIKKAYDSVRKEVLYNIFIQFDIAMKLVRLIKNVSE
jgi:hypothetical protein